MKLYIPDIKDKLVLSNDWTFDLYEEYRNHKLLKALEIKLNESPNYWDRIKEKHSVILLKDTELVVDRIYIRKGREMADFSSVSFIINSSNKKINKCRFWAKLEDVNKIEFSTAELSERTKQLKFPTVASIIGASGRFSTKNRYKRKELDSLIGVKTRYPFFQSLCDTESVLLEGNLYIYQNEDTVFEINSMTFIVEKYFNIHTIKEAERDSFFGFLHHDTLYFDVLYNNSYKLWCDGKELGEWKTPASLINYMKKYVK